MDKHSLLIKIDDFIRRKDFVAARKLIRNDLKRIGTKFDYYFYMGVASDIPEDRLECFKTAYEIDSNNLDIIINLANAQDENGNYDLAVEGYNKALAIDNKNPLIYNNRGYSYFQKKEYEKALNDYNQALLLSPKLKIAEYNKQDLLKILKEDEKYSSLLKETDTLNQDYNYYFNLGMEETNLGNYNEAMTAFNQVISIKPDFAPVYMFIGILEFQKQNYTKAYEYYTKSIECDDKLIDAYFNRGQIVFATKTIDKTELKSALSDFEKAVELDPKFIDAYYSMAVVLKNLGDYIQAIAALDKILKIDNESVNAKALKKLLMKNYLN